jgi:hypothetical protein
MDMQIEAQCGYRILMMKSLVTCEIKKCGRITFRAGRCRLKCSIGVGVLF